MTGARTKMRIGEPAYIRLLLRIRAQHGWTQKELAGALGCSRGTIAKWEGGVRQPRVMLMMALRVLDGEIDA